LQFLLDSVFLGLQFYPELPFEPELLPGTLKFSLKFPDLLLEILILPRQLIDSVAQLAEICCFDFGIGNRLMKLLVFAANTFIEVLD
jgi:hypothetical protein